MSVGGFISPDKSFQNTSCGPFIFCWRFVSWNGAAVAFGLMSASRKVKRVEQVAGNVVRNGLSASFLSEWKNRSSLLNGFLVKSIQQKRRHLLIAFCLLNTRLIDFEEAAIDRWRACVCVCVFGRESRRIEAAQKLDNS